jgi:serine/threonine protein kinase
MKIKNGSSIFLPKYYIVTNRANPHADAVFMDFIPSRNLKEYLHLSATSISLLTKLYLAFSVAQALRYIRDYRIVHLDLKPNNIMVYCNMLVKLIDFG